MSADTDKSKRYIGEKNSISILIKPVHVSSNVSYLFKNTENPDICSLHKIYY